jgi:DNA-binding IclR family transcriptional regulator
VSSTSGVQSIERAFAVLRALATEPAGISEVARRVDLPTSTVARLLGTLATLGAVSRVDDSAAYRVGPTLADLAAAADPSAGLITASRAFLAELVERLGETAGLSILDGDQVLYLDQVESANEVQVRDWTGTRLPWHVVSSGLVLAAHLEPERAEAWLREPHERFTARTVTDAATLRSRLEAARDQGYVWTIEEFHEGISSVAAPVLTSTGGAVTAVAAIHCHGPSYRFPAPGQEDEIGAIVHDVANRLAVRLGPRPDPGAS